MNKEMQIAERIARKAHKKQKRKFGKQKGLPYFETHVQWVAGFLIEAHIDPLNPTENEIAQVCAALLHDVVEDHADRGYDFDYLRERGISDRVIEIVEFLTKRPNEQYFDFIMRISKDYDAAAVKIADITHNLRDCPDGNLKQKYLLARELLFKIGIETSIS